MSLILCPYCKQPNADNQDLCLSCGRPLIPPAAATFQPAIITSPPPNLPRPDATLSIVLSVLMLCWCQPLAIVALVFSILGHTSATSGQFPQAYAHLKVARTCLIIGFAGPLVVLTVYFLLFCCAGIAGPAGSIAVGR